MHKRDGNINELEYKINELTNDLVGVCLHHATTIEDLHSMQEKYGNEFNARRN